MLERFDVEERQMSDSHTLGEDKNTRAPCVPPVWGGRERCRCPPFSQSKARTNPQGTQLPVLPSPQAALTLLPRSDKEQGPRALGIRWTLCPSAGRGWHSCGNKPGPSTWGAPSWGHQQRQQRCGHSGCTQGVATGQDLLSSGLWRGGTALFGAASTVCPAFNASP